MQQVSPELHHRGDECRLNYLRGVTTRTPSPSAPAQKSLRRRRLALRRGNEGGARAKAGPVCGCRLQGPELFLRPVRELAPADEELAGLEVELEPGAVCFCQKVDCRAAILGKASRKRTLKGHMAGEGWAPTTRACRVSTRSRRSKRDLRLNLRRPVRAQCSRTSLSPLYSPCPPLCLCGRHANLTKMGPRARGDKLGEVRSEYIVFGDLVSHSPYVYCMTAYWVPLSKLIKDVTRAKAVNGIEIFEGNLAQLREIEMAELLSEDEESASMIAFGGRRGPHRSGSRCRGRPIERREAGREGCLWPNAASQGRPPDGSGG